MTILVVDDDPRVREHLGQALRSSGDGWDVRFAETATEALARFTEPDVECVLLDYRLPDGDGLSVLREMRRRRPDLPVVLVTGTGSEMVAVEAMQLGAANYVVKDSTYVLAVPGIVREALGSRALAQLMSQPDGALAREPPPVDAATQARFEAEGFIVRSPAMLRVLRLIERAAQSRATVLIEGESGTGKELCARALHTHGPRAAQPFLAQNCAAVTETLLESELFGHVRGAFTGAVRDHPGLFTRADGGTVFLDEIGEATPSIQAKLLRVLEDREIRPVGGTDVQRVDVRVVAATNRDLRYEIDARRFRRDLFHRLRVFPIVLPPLRERREDIAPLAQHFLERLAREEQKPLAGFHPDALVRLQRYRWEGNARELENEVHRLVLCAEPDDEIAPDALAPWITNDVDRSPETAAPLREVVRQVETALIQRRLREHGHRKAEAAKSLGISRESLWMKLRDLGLVPQKQDDST